MSRHRKRLADVTSQEETAEVTSWEETADVMSQEEAADVRPWIQALGVRSTQAEIILTCCNNVGLTQIFCVCKMNNFIIDIINSGIQCQCICQITHINSPMKTVDSSLSPASRCGRIIARVNLLKSNVMLSTHRQVAEELLHSMVIAENDNLFFRLLT